MKLERHRWRILMVIVAVALLFTAFAVFWSSRLSPEEEQLVGVWSLGSSPGALGWRFTSNRKYSSSDGQIAGVWELDQGRLTLRMWRAWRRPNFLSISSIKWSLQEYRQSRTNNSTVTLDIELSENESVLTVIKPADEQHPDGRQVWHRVPVR